MANALIETIVSEKDSLRNRSIDSLLKNKNKNQLLKLAGELESFRESCKNLYHKVRASLFLFVIYRFYLEKDRDVIQHGEIPLKGIKAAFDRDFEKSVNIYIKKIKDGNQNSAVFSAIAESYYNLSFEYLLKQVKLSISQCSENFLLFNIKGLDDYPYSVPEEFTTPDSETGLYPVGVDTSPVRLDPSHSGWSDIFFLGMDFPEGARVVNLSVNLKIHDTDEPILPPCECYCRFIEEPLIHLISIDLKASKKILTLEELFNFGNDYLSLLKAGVVASGIVPPCFEKKDLRLKDILQKLLGSSGGIEIVTKVNNIPKGSRLAVSTTLLSTVITRLMRFSRQIKNQTGPLKEEERRIVASRAILGEWLGGSGGGWQDSGGLWPGIKVITGKLAKKGHPEFGISRGCLLPEHNIFSEEDLSKEVEEKIVKSLVLVHGGISQDVGPILEMVTEKYLLRYKKEWLARRKGIYFFDKIVDALKIGDMKNLGRLTTHDWEESIQKIIPWVKNAFTEDLINQVKKEFKKDYWGFLMLGGMSGGGMAFIVNPKIKKTFKDRVSVIMQELKNKYCFSLPFIIDPVVYDFKLNHNGNVAQLLTGTDAKIPDMHKVSTENKTYNSSSNLLVNCTAMSLRGATATKQSHKGIENKKIATSRIIGARNDKKKISEGEWELDEQEIKKKYGFDLKSHEHVKLLLKKGAIGLAKNRLPQTTNIQDISYDEIFHFEDENNNTLPFIPSHQGRGKLEGTSSRGKNVLQFPSTLAGEGQGEGFYELGINALKRNEIAVVTLAGGMGSRWTQGAAVVKPINPFIWMNGKHRTFIEIHLAKSRKTGKLYGCKIPHVFTTSYLTDNAIVNYLERFNYFNYGRPIYLSPAKSIGRRVYPMERDLRFFWKEQLQQKLDENTQKVQDDIHNALIEWAKSRGEGEDYSENKPILRFNPPGHWYEIPNLIKNGALAKMITENHDLKYLLCHNIDTVGACIEPALLGIHVANQSCLTFEVTPRRIEDRGGGLAKINGHIRLIEGLALPREEYEYKLSYYNTLTNWITIDSLLEFFNLNRDLILHAEKQSELKNKIIDAIHEVENRIPTYVTIKNVKHVWGSGQEDVYPVAQFEKLWGDMTGLKDLKASYVSVSRYRGQQLKEPSQLDRWLMDGSFEYVKKKTFFTD